MHIYEVPLSWMGHPVLNAYPLSLEHLFVGQFSLTGSKAALGLLHYLSTVGGPDTPAGAVGHLKAPDVSKTD